MLKLVVFDWDGTLADSVSKIIACKSYLAEKYNLPKPPENFVKSVLGKKFEIALAQCFPSASSQTLSSLAEDYHSLMQQKDYQASLFPGALDVLVYLKNRGMKLAIASAKNKHELDSAILHNKLEGMFDWVCCGSEYKDKPDPAMLNHLLAQSNISKDKCLMIGDTVSDILFAANAQVKFIGVTFGAHSAETLQSMQPLTLIEEWPQVTGIINKLCNLEQTDYSLSSLQES